MKPTPKSCSGADSPGPFKDGINDYVVNGNADTFDLEFGTKVSAQVKLTLPPGGQHVIRLRWRPVQMTSDPFVDHDDVMAARLADADEFYEVLQRHIDDPDARLVQRQALAGMLWSKMFYLFDMTALA